MEASPLNSLQLPQLKPTTRMRRFATARAIAALILREMTTSYGRSPGGYLWAFLEPAAGIALLSIVFSLGFRTPSLGTDFVLFFTTGLIPFLAYMTTSNNMASALTFSRTLLVYPAVTFIDALLARFILTLLTQILVGYVLLTGAVVFSSMHVQLDAPKALLSLSMVAALAFGVGTLNCFLFTRFPLWGQIWAILNRPMLIISGVLILFDVVPEPYRSYLWWNPLIHVVGQMRAAFYPYYEATYVSPPFIFGLSLVLTTIGLILLRRFHRDLLNI